jgi:hypothetical protein
VDVFKTSSAGSSEKRAAFIHSRSWWRIFKMHISKRYPGPHSEPQWATCGPRSVCYEGLIYQHRSLWKYADMLQQWPHTDTWQPDRIVCFFFFVLPISQPLGELVP